MALKSNVTDREMQKFVETKDGEHAVRVVPFGAFDVPPETDYMKGTYPDSLTEVYTFKTGGSGGVTVLTVTVTYTTASKKLIDEVVRS